MCQFILTTPRDACIGVPDYCLNNIKCYLCVNLQPSSASGIGNSTGYRDICTPDRYQLWHKHNFIWNMASNPKDPDSGKTIRFRTRSKKARNNDDQSTYKYTVVRDQGITRARIPDSFLPPTEQPGPCADTKVTPPNKPQGSVPDAPRSGNGWYRLVLCLNENWTFGLPAWIGYLSLAASLLHIVKGSLGYWMWLQHSFSYHTCI